jgi:radical SAM protein with 4Fe4S-binding SPASM domain
MSKWFFHPDPPPGGEAPARQVMFHGSEPRWLVVNATTREIAGLLGAHGDEAGAAAALTVKYGIDPDQARRDVGLVAGELRRNGFLDDGATRERTLAAHTLFLHVTHRCNLACLHCYQACGHLQEDMPLDAACRLIDQAAEHGTRGVTISGGEPLLHPEARALIGHAAERMRVRVLSNGWLVDDDWAAFLAGSGAAVQLSLDGADPLVHDRIRGEGSHAAVLAAVERLQRAGMGAGVSFSTTIMKQNLGQLAGVIDLADELGIPLVRFLPLGRRGRADGNWDAIGEDVAVADHEAFYRLVAERQRGGGCAVSVSCGLSGFLLEVTEEIAPDGIWCSVGRTLVADVDGSAYPCVLLMRDEYRLGNLITDGVEPVLAHPSLARVTDEMVERRQRIGECAGCPFRNLCQAGCMGQALDHRGTTAEPDDFCAYRKQAYVEAFDGILRREEGR